MTKKKKRKILILLGELKHKFANERQRLVKIMFHLRNFRKAPGSEYLTPYQNTLLAEIENEISAFNGIENEKGLGYIASLIDNLIEEA